MHRCLVCTSDLTETILELGRQPVSSHFLKARDQRVVEHDLALALCRRCGVVQLARPFPFRDLVPPYDWITYREPETHLDAVVEKVCTLAEIGTGTVVAGLTFKDKTALERFRGRGVSRIWSLDLSEDLHASNPNANIETVQGLLTPETAIEIARRRSPADILFIRHILEHTEQPQRFMRAVGELLAPDGLLVIEVPDCRANLERQDYTMIWEEHTLYLTPETIAQTLHAAGCTVVASEIHPFPFEDVIVVYARKSPAATPSAMPVAADAVARNTELARSFGRSFPTWTERYRRVFASLTGDGRKLAVYGAGHLSCAFLNFHGLTDYFAGVVDDSPQKQGLYLPKCGLPIMPRSTLAGSKVSACFFGLAPQLEEQIIANCPDYVAAGGRFFSLFADSERSIRHLVDAGRPTTSST